MSHLVMELEEAIKRGSQERRIDTLRQVTDLFLHGSAGLSDDQIDLFDVVIARLAAAIESRARAELSERLADAPNAPRGVLRLLAHDEIEVARLVLRRSERLSDDDLVAVALAKGRDHMLAICERETLNEPVTSVLVSRGDQVIVHAVAGNPGARLSEASIATLLDKSRIDATLQNLLGERDDLPEEHVRQLVVIAKESARRRLAATMPTLGAPAIDGAIERGATQVEAAIVPGGRDYSEALAAVKALAEEHPLTEADLALFATSGSLEAAICTLSRLAGLSLPAVERLFLGGEPDLVLLVAKAQDWSWATVRALLRLRNGDPLAPQSLRRAETTYDGLSPATAQRVVHFIKARELSQRQAAEAAAQRRQTRSKVR